MYTWVTCVIDRRKFVISPQNTWPTNSRENSPSWKASQGFFHIIGNPKFHWHFHNVLLLVTNTSSINLVHVISSYFLKIHIIIIIIIPSLPTSYNHFPCLRVVQKNSISVYFFLPYEPKTVFISFSLFDHSNNTWWRAQLTTISPSTYFFYLLASNIFLIILFLSISSICSLLNLRYWISHP